MRFSGNWKLYLNLNDLRTLRAYKLDFQKHVSCKYKKTPCHPDYSKNKEEENTSSALSLSSSTFKYHTTHIGMALIILKVNPEVKKQMFPSFI